ncbi:glycosyl hydrolase [Fusarium oxysporum]|nr:glycosyl hydrolase [Fusarium oxysporum]
MFKFIVSGLKVSTDRTSWRDAGAAFPNGAPWTTMYTKGDPNLWAPDISYHNGKYLMYYSASSFGSRTGMTSIAARPNNGGELEAPFITKRGNYYYLWTSFDRCCKGKDSTYRIMVGRATNIKGPYVDKSGRQMMQGSGTQIIAGHGQIRGPGHNAVVTDNNTDVLVYHYFDATRGDARIDINLLRYGNGWPVAY